MGLGGLVENSFERRGQQIDLSESLDLDLATIVIWMIFEFIDKLVWFCL